MSVAVVTHYPEVEDVSLCSQEDAVSLPSIPKTASGWIICEGRKRTRGSRVSMTPAQGRGGKKQGRRDGVWMQHWYIRIRKLNKDSKFRLSSAIVIVENWRRTDGLSWLQSQGIDALFMACCCPLTSFYFFFSFLFSVLLDPIVLLLTLQEFKGHNKYILPKVIYQ